MLNNKKGHMNIPACELPMVEHSDDFRSTFQWRIFRIMAEFVEGFQFLADFKKTVTVFGSARSKEDDRWYKEAQKLGHMLSKQGFDIITGGGPGIMEAANRGAFEAGPGLSVGLNIQLPHEQRINPYVKRGHGFHYFFSRKVMLSYAAQAYVYFPGGFGTLDEFFELITLIQTKKIPFHIPIILVGEEFWGPIVNFFHSHLVEKFGTIGKEDTDLYEVVDSAEEAFKIIKKSPLRKQF